MGFFKRLFSADYRAAVAAEAAGDYELAAERYALAGHREAAVRVHLARASRAGSRGDEINALRDALHWADEATPERRRVVRALGQALLVKSQAEGVATERDRERVREAAAMLVEAGEHRAAGEAYESLGDDAAAAAAYRQGGMLDLMEQSLMRDEERSAREREVRQSFADYELHLRGGARDAALEAIRREGVTLVFVEQDVTRSLAFSDHMICLHRGAVRLEGRSGTRSLEEVRHAYFG